VVPVDALTTAGYPQSMTAALQAVLEQAQRLTADEREELALALLAERDEPNHPPGWTEAWRDELTKRRAAYESGKVVGKPFDDALAEMEAELDAIRP
jgi:putative addiction module component (TIGR02574 family)